MKLRLLGNFAFVTSAQYRATTTCDVQVDLGKGFAGYHEFCHRGTLWGVLYNDHLTIFTGYSWDLCSPSFKIFGRWFGTPSRGHELASLIHDFTRQFLAAECCPWTRADTDEWFLHAPPAPVTLSRRVYHHTVAGFAGSAYMRLSRRRDDITCKVCQPRPQS